MRSAAQILLVDDDSELCALMTDFFSRHGFEIETAHDGRGGLARALEAGFDLIILDVMLPVLDGFEVLAQLRRRSAVPVIMLTARTGQEDRIAGLDAGADDYLPKPFGPEELLARSSGRIVSRDELAAALYQRESTPHERSLDVHMSHLRKKLASGERTLIRTVRGVGYLFSAGSSEAE